MCKTWQAKRLIRTFLPNTRRHAFRGYTADSAPESASDSASGSGSRAAVPPAGPAALVGPLLIATLIAGFIWVLPLSSRAETAGIADKPVTGAEQTSQQTSQKTKQQAAEPDGLDDLSDTQLTRLAADWGTLDGVERTELIQETRQRMQPQRPTERRRYGRLVRQPDGTVVRSVVEVQTRVRVQSGDRRQAFGVGFERRHNGEYKAQYQEPPKAAAPNSVISVSATPKR